MQKRFWIASAAFALLAPAAALAQPGGLPDFPADAEPGACYARLRGDGQAAAVSGVQPVWTVKRGHGPEAVWRYSEQTVPGAAADAPAGDYQWVRVECQPGQTPFNPSIHAGVAPPSGTTGAGVPPPPFAAPPPPPPMIQHHGPASHGASGDVVVVRPHGGPPHGAHHALPHHGQFDAPPPSRDVIIVRPRPHGGHPAPGMHAPNFAPSHAEPPGVFVGPPPHGPVPHHGPGFGPHFAPQFAGPAFAPPPAPISRPRWFGDRFLTWSGKGR